MISLFFSTRISNFLTRKVFFFFFWIKKEIRPFLHLSILVFFFFFFLFFVFKKIFIFKKLSLLFNHRFLNQNDFSFFKSFLCLFLLFFLLNIFFKTCFGFFFYTLVLITLSVILTPIMYVFGFLLSFFTVINSTKSKNVFETTWSDFISLISFFLRFMVQLIRILLIIVVNGLLLEYVSSFSIKFNFFFHQKGFILSNFNLQDFFFVTIRFFLENLDFCFILLIQFFAYILVLFWLLSFLLLTEVFSFFEKPTLNFFLKYSFMQITLLFSLFYFFKKLHSLGTSLFFVFFLIFNVVVSSFLLIFFGFENFFGFIFITETSAIFLIIILLSKERFFLNKKKNLTPLVFFVFFTKKSFFFCNFCFFTFYLKKNTNNDLFFLFSNISLFPLLFYLFIFFTICNFLFFTFLSKKKFKKSLFFKKNFFLKKNFYQHEKGSFFFLKKIK